MLAMLAKADAAKQVGKAGIAADGIKAGIHFEK
jgi:hypothetical protein